MDVTPWRFLGPLRGMPDHWTIDATVFALQNSLYCCYSGWPLGDHSDTEQDLFLIRLISPEEADLNSLVCISKPTLDWERLDNRGINEGPQFLHTPDFIGIVYSACGSWTNKYKLGALQLVGEGVMSTSSWRKLEKPLMMSDPDGKHGPHGPGHAS
jgi:GH43 family beta-xylosidase